MKVLTNIYDLIIIAITKRRCFMDNLSLLKLEQSETTNTINKKREELHVLEKRLQELEDKIAELTKLRGFCLSIPAILKDKIKSEMKLVPAIILLSTFLITAIVACMGYSLETGWQIKEIITALIASSSISTVAATSLAVYSYKSLKKDLGGYSLKKVTKELEKNNEEFNEVLDKATTTEKELSQLEVKLYDTDEKIRLLMSNHHGVSPETELQVPVAKQEHQKVKSLSLNIKKNEA